jgi:DNA-binding winged helix-turn-helix (wHTH) protein
MALQFGEFVADPEQRQLLRKGQPVHLSPKALQLLLILLEAAPRALSKRELQEQIWPDTFVSEASLANLISELRRAIGGPDDTFIRTVHGFGYAFQPDPQADSTERVPKPVSTNRTAAVTIIVVLLLALAAVIISLTRNRARIEPQVSKSALEDYLSVRSSLAGIERGGKKTRMDTLARLNSILQREPRFARALAARAYVEGSFNFWEPSMHWYSAAMTDADRALAIDPSLIEPHLARAYVLNSSAGGWKIFESLKELRLAASMSPGHDITHQRLARLYRHLGWFDELNKEADAVERINPQATELPRLRALRLIDSGRCREALVEYAKARPIAGDPFPLWQQVAIAHLYCRQVPEARQRLETEYAGSSPNAPERPLTAALLALAISLSGERDTRDLEREALSTDQRIGHFHHVLITLAEVRALQGDSERALDYLTRAADEGMPCVACFENDPFLQNARSSRRFQSLVAELRRREAPYRSF